MFDETDQLAVNTIRMLAIDAIENAGSGHPGLPLGAAPMAYVLFRNHMRVTPQDVKWFNRDRFILSAGHGSAMLYALEHIAGFDITTKDLQGFRQIGSRTPGHPEFGLVPGVEATTGPLGQGLGMAVGMAMAEQHLANQYNRPNANVVDHFTFVLASDGDLMEGISHESGSLAGQLGLGKLIVLLDSNDVTLDGPKGRSEHNNNGERFKSYGWDYQRVEDGTNLADIDAAITAAKANTEQPSLIEVRTVIGFGTPNEGTNKVHGSVLSKADVAALRLNLGWDKPEFTTPAAVTKRMRDTLGRRGRQAQCNWLGQIANLQEQDDDLAEQLLAAMAGTLPANWQAALPNLTGQEMAGRDASQQVINALGPAVPQLWGGSADLASSNKTNLPDTALFERGERGGRNVAFGIREFAEAAAMNGIALHGGTRIFGSTFLVFSDYMKGAIRLSALQKLPVIYIFTHDSIAVGEDGPTHQPIEQLMALRNIPGVTVIRPGDAQDTVRAWRQALENTDGPTVLVLTRQKMMALPQPQCDTSMDRGGAIIAPVSAGRCQDGILVATGSEIELALKTQRVLAIQDVFVSVVGISSFEIFAKQSKAYRELVLPRNIRRRMSLELGSTLGWERFVGFEGVTLGIDTFGASGECSALLRRFGFTPIHAADAFLSMAIENDQPAIQPLRQIG